MQYTKKARRIFNDLSPERQEEVDRRAKELAQTFDHKRVTVDDIESAIMVAGDEFMPSFELTNMIAGDEPDGAFWAVAHELGE